MKDLSDRQKKILYCLVREYVKSGIPVSSQKVLETTNLEWSGATVRNDMRKLDYLGYVFQPHTSAGRIPTDKGLKFYVNEVLKVRKETKKVGSSIDVRTDFPIGDLDKVIRGAAKLLSNTLKAFVIIEKPNPMNLRIRRIVLTPVTKTFSIVNIITELGLTSVLPIQHSEISNILEIEEFLNKSLDGILLSDFKLKLKEVVEKFSWVGGRLKEFIELSERIASEKYDEYIIEGVFNLVNAKKFGEDKLREIVKISTNSEFYPQIFSLGEGIYVGKEHNIRNFEQYAVLIMPYFVFEREVGRIAVIFDKFSDYSKVFDSVEYVVNRLTEYFTIVARNVE
ncbi:HrcA family transcriptional regulator [Thermosipho sp. 1063]|uniref:heat-inducible transcriptional repressor HrcA n=1 Tax=unclassified Thermosipho (in: thermotogales) TaxID=2676525 RepID=UPI0009493CDC|nr:MULTISPECIES: heat-inducible transcriptional repressor HrcA [unclassified Thermosipho (in: thermotogales)]ANQ53222.1 HrcA family transcriptional regulator [Thermosipho sp. 1070]APT71672.1 HrcA family transcriptional regulator [Thermosipho sp. 1063]OOC45188.1 HrcA family transcriptional regulator [Thermosipho sp. 1074]